MSKVYRVSVVQTHSPQLTDSYRLSILSHSSVLFDHLLIGRKTPLIIHKQGALVPPVSGLQSWPRLEVSPVRGISPPPVGELVLTCCCTPMLRWRTSRYADLDFINQSGSGKLLEERQENGFLLISPSSVTDQHLQIMHWHQRLSVALRHGC